MCIRDRQNGSSATTDSYIVTKYSANGDDGKDLADAFIEKLKPGSGVRMRQFGTGKAKANLSTDWVKWGGVDGTPKTDMYTYEGADDNVVHAISLKKAGGSQIASSMQGETIATFKAALEHLGGEWKSDFGVDKLITSIENDFTKLTTEYTKTELLKISKDKRKQKGLSDVDVKALNQFMETEQFHKDFNVTLSETLNSNVGNSHEFKEAYLFEALSGTKKFSVKKCRASVCIEFDPNSGKIKHYTPITSDGKFQGISGKTEPTSFEVSEEVSDLAKKCKIYSAWKSAKGNPYSALRIGAGMKTNSYNPMVEGVSTPFRDMIRNEVINDGIAQVMLQEEIDQLDEFRIIKRVFNKMKSLGKDAIKWVTGLLQKIADKLSQKLNELKKLGSRFFEGLFDFFGIELKNVTTSIPKEIKGFI